MIFCALNINCVNSVTFRYSPYFHSLVDHQIDVSSILGRVRFVRVSNTIKLLCPDLSHVHTSTASCDGIGEYPSRIQSFIICPSTYKIFIRVARTHIYIHVSVFCVYVFDVLLIYFPTCNTLFLTHINMSIL